MKWDAAIKEIWKGETIAIDVILVKGIIDDTVLF